MNRDEQVTLRNLIGGAEIENSDCLAIIVATYFEDHPDCPDEPIDEETGWKPWAIEKTDEVLERAAEILSENRKLAES